MVRTRLEARFSRFPWPEQADYSDDEDWEADMRINRQRDLEQLQRVDSDLQAAVFELMQDGMRLSAAHDQVRRNHANDSAQRLDAALVALKDEVPPLLEAFDDCINLWYDADPRLCLRFQRYSRVATKATDAPNRQLLMMEWFDTPDYVQNALKRLRLHHDKIARKRLEIDRVWRNYEGISEGARDPHHDGWWSAMWDEEDVLYGHEFEPLPAGFQSLDDFGHDRASYNTVRALWITRTTRLSHALRKLEAGNGTPDDFVIPNRLNMFERDLIELIESFFTEDVQFVGNLSDSWRDLGVDVLDALEQRPKLCDYYDDTTLMLNDRAYFLVASPDNNNYGRVTQSNPLLTVADWLDCHVPVYRWVDLEQGQEDEQPE